MCGRFLACNAYAILSGTNFLLRAFQAVKMLTER